MRISLPLLPKASVGMLLPPSRARPPSLLTPPLSILGEAWGDDPRLVAGPMMTSAKALTQTRRQPPWCPTWTRFGRSCCCSRRVHRRSLRGPCRPPARGMRGNIANHVHNLCMACRLGRWRVAFRRVSASVAEVGSLPLTMRDGGRSSGLRHDQ
jgi:hypothetical protein